MRFFFLALALTLDCITPAPRASMAPGLGFVDQAETSVPAEPSYSPAELTGEVSEETVLPIILLLALQPERVVIRIDSPGGSVYAGMQLIAVMREAQHHGTQIACVVDGYAASMAAVILQACDVRLMTRQSALLFHTVSTSGAEGNAWELERLVKSMQQLNHRIAIFVSGRLNISLKEYEAHTSDTDWWLGYEEALAVGAVDGVL